MTRQVSPLRPQPVSGLMASASVYITVSRSGAMWSPWRTVSSPVLTTAAISEGGTTSTSPRSSRAAPTPPANAVITAEPLAFPSSNGATGRNLARFCSASCGGSHRGRLPGLRPPATRPPATRPRATRPGPPAPAGSHCRSARPCPRSPRSARPGRRPDGARGKAPHRPHRRADLGGYRRPPLIAAPASCRRVQGSRGDAGAICYLRPGPVVRRGRGHGPARPAHRGGCLLPRSSRRALDRTLARGLGLRGQLAPSTSAPSTGAERDVDPPTGHAGSATARRLGEVAPAALGVVHRSPRRGARNRFPWCRRPDGLPCGDRARPDRRALSGTVRSATRCGSRNSSVGPWKTGHGSTLRPSSSPTRWWRRSRSPRAGPGCPSRDPRPIRPGGPDGPDDPTRSPIHLPEGCDRYVLAVGTIEPRKDYPLLVSAFDRIGGTHRSVALVVVGAEGWGAERFTAAVEASPGGTGSFVPAISTTGVSMPPCDTPRCLAYPSRYEGVRIPSVASHGGLGPGGRHRRRGRS